MRQPERVSKSSTEKVLFGVCGGLGEYFRVDPLLVRLAFILLTFASGAGLLLYIVLALLMPTKQSAAASPTEVMKENVQNLPRETAEVGRSVGEMFRSDAAGRKSRDRAPSTAAGASERRTMLGLVLVLVGVVVLVANVGLFWWARWSLFWPLALVAIGAAVLMAGSKQGRS